MRRCCWTGLNVASDEHVLARGTITCILQKFILGPLFSLNSGRFIIASKQSVLPAISTSALTYCGTQELAKV